MSAVMVTPAYAALLGLLFIALSIRTLRLRRSLKIGIGDDGDQRMLRAMRVHSNFAEYTPLALLLILMCELMGGGALLIHSLCLSLLLGRLVHAWGVSQSDEDYRYRVCGMTFTFAALGGAAVAILYGLAANSA